MTTQFPANLDNFTNPTPADKLSTPTVLHSDQHSNENDAIEALERKVGIDSSTDPASLDYRIAHVGSAPFDPNSPVNVGANPIVGTSGSSSRGDHVHRGIAGIYTVPNSDIFGSVELVAGTNVTIAQSSGSFTISATAGAATPAGSNTQVQYNDNGSFGADANLAWNKATEVLSVGASGSPANISSSSALTIITSGSANDINLSPGRKVNIVDPTSGKIATLSTSSITSDHVYVFPDTAGTLALASDLSGYAPTSRRVDTNAPLTGGGDLSTNRTLSISQSSHTTDGYLSAADWTTFNNKQGNLTPFQTDSPASVAAAAMTGTSGSVPHSDHVHQGVHGLFVAPNSDVYGDVALVAGSNVTITQSSGSFTIAASASGLPAGINTQVQYNDGGAFGADANLTWNKAAEVLSIGATGASSISASGVLNITSGSLNNINVTPGDHLAVVDPVSGKSAILSTSSLSDSRTIIFPDASGVLALTSRFVNTAAPLQGGGNLTADRTVSITQSSHTTDGYLSANDWTTFNSKVSNAIPFDTGSPVDVGASAVTGSSGSMSHADHVHRGVHGLFAAPNVVQYGDISLVGSTNISIVQSSGSFTFSSSGSFLPQVHDINGLYHNGTPLRSENGGTGINNGANTLVIPASGTAALGTGTAGRVASWSNANTLAASTLIKVDSGIVTIGTANTADNTTLNILGGYSIGLRSNYAVTADIYAVPSSGLYGIHLDNGNYTFEIAGTTLGNQSVHFGGGDGTINFLGNPTLNIITSGSLNLNSNTLVLSGGNPTTSITGGGTLVLGGFTLTVPATGTAALGAGTLTVSTSNNATGASHTHAITSGSNPGASASLLSTNSFGNLTLAGLTVTSLTLFNDVAVFYDPVSFNSMNLYGGVSGLTGARNVYIPDESGTVALLSSTPTWTSTHTFSNTAESTSTSTGVIVTSGGIGVAKNVTVGGTIKSPVATSGYLSFLSYGSLSSGIATSGTVVCSTSIGYACTLLRWSSSTVVSTTNNGSNYWTIALYNLGTNALISSFTTASDTAGAWTYHGVTGLSTALATSDIGMYIYVTKTGSPGALSLAGVAAYSE